MVWSSNDSVKNFQAFLFVLELSSQFMEYNYIYYIYVKIN